MDRKYWNYQVDIINILDNDFGGIIALKNKEQYMEVSVSYLNEEALSKLQRICDESGLCYKYKSHTAVIRSRKHKEIPSVLFKFTENTETP